MKNTNDEMIKKYGEYAMVVMRLSEILNNYRLDEFEIIVKSINLNIFENMIEDKKMPYIEIYTLEEEGAKYYDEYCVELDKEDKDIDYNINYILEELKRVCNNKMDYYLSHKNDPDMK